jgi:hypothetical protein
VRLPGPPGRIYPPLDRVWLCAATFCGVAKIMNVEHVKSTDGARPCVKSVAMTIPTILQYRRCRNEAGFGRIRNVSLHLNPCHQAGNTLPLASSARSSRSAASLWPIIQLAISCCNTRICSQTDIRCLHHSVAECWAIGEIAYIPDLPDLSCPWGSAASPAGAMARTMLI